MRRRQRDQARDRGDNRRDDERSTTPMRARAEGDQVRRRTLTMAGAAREECGVTDTARRNVVITPRNYVIYSAPPR